MILRQIIILFSIAKGGAKIFEVFRVKNHDFTPIFFSFFPILGGARAGCPPPPESAPGLIACLLTCLLACLID
jgi:hypothetical protein